VISREEECDLAAIEQTFDIDNFHRQRMLANDDHHFLFEALLVQLQPLIPRHVVLTRRAQDRSGLGFGVGRDIAVDPLDQTTHVFTLLRLDDDIVVQLESMMIAIEKELPAGAFEFYLKQFCHLCL
jgi:hypothetical protein